MMAAAKGAVLFLSALLALSPVLRTLTEDTSSNTVWACVGLLFLTNVLLHDYSAAGVTEMGRSVVPPRQHAQQRQG
jgi:phosphatidylinositol N-acetylglucosaminyltransferase subunit C